MGYYKIYEVKTVYGLFELWEDETYGDEVPAMVTLNNIKVGVTYDSLETFIKDNYYIEEEM